MHEQLARQLGPDAQRALRLATRLLGKEPKLSRKQELPNEVRGMLIRPLNPRKPCEIQIARGQERFLDHIVTHEVGHVVRLHQVPEAERLLAISTADNRHRAILQIAPEIVAVQQQGIPEHAIPALFEMWFQSVCSQVVNFPADLRIETWINREYPGLRPVQRRSLLAEVDRGGPSFRPEVIALTPPTIYRATVAMNAAQALHVAELYDTPSLADPYRRAGFGELGNKLMEMALAPGDQGHPSDIAATNAWARELGLQGWVSWRSPDEERCLGVEVGTR